jgi:tRNA-guanine family transglycosylase
MNWKKPIMTDSSGFQVFSLGFGKDFGVTKFLGKGMENKKTTKCFFFLDF